MSAVADATGQIAALADDLRRIVGPKNVRDAPTELRLYRHDASNLEGTASLVCFPATVAEVAAVVAAAHRHGLPFVARGSGTGLTGGAVPVDGALVVSLTKLDRVGPIDVGGRRAWVEPGVLNLDLTRRVADDGLHFAPDPSSQQTCSIGGNVANNSGGPHCLADGVTTSHVLAIDVVLPDGATCRLGGDDPEPPGYDLRGAFVGSEGLCGIATNVLVRLSDDPPAVTTMLMDFVEVVDAAGAVSDIIAAGIVPAAIEMMDRLCLEAVEAYIAAGLPTDCAAALLIELAGPEQALQAQTAAVRRIAAGRSVRTVRVAADEAERALLWKGRKSAFGAIARIKPNYYLHDTVVPRERLPEILAEVYAVAAANDLLVLNVFHAGDGNLHPILAYDAAEPGIAERVHAAGDAIVRASVAAGGVLSGEHGIGLEKRDLMPLMFSPDDLAAQAALRAAFDPDGRANPGKVLPSPARCGDLGAVPDGTWI